MPRFTCHQRVMPRAKPKASARPLSRDGLLDGAVVWGSGLSRQPAHTERLLRARLAAASLGQIYAPFTADGSLGSGSIGITYCVPETATPWPVQ